ncbi:MAG: hypothetical protein ABSD98_11370 [Candidatus Korobacteraceae bacterium]|jgi:hypothetical protein
MKAVGAHRLLFCCALGAGILYGGCRAIAAQSVPASGKSESSVTPNALARDFFAAIRAGDTRKILSYVPERGVDLGPQAQPASRTKIEQQFLAHRGLYCRLLDSSCIDAPIHLDNSARACSYRELLTHSEKVRTAASEVTRNGVRQAVLVAQIKNDRCSNGKLIDFIFNLEADGWKLFSIP